MRGSLKSDMSDEMHHRLHYLYLEHHVPVSTIAQYRLKDDSLCKLTSTCSIHIYADVATMTAQPAPPPKSLLGRHRLLAPTASVYVSPICLGAMNFGVQSLTFCTLKIVELTNSRTGSMDVDPRGMQQRDVV